MFNKKKIFISLPLVLTTSLVVSNIDIAYAKKEIYTSFKSINFKNKPKEFNQATLESIANGQDIVPGLIEREAQCSKYIRANIDTLLGSDFFKKNEIISKLEAKINGKTSLPGDKYGIYGNAWDMYHNIQKKDGVILYETKNPVLENEKSINFLLNNGKIGDIIGFYFPDSKYNERAKLNGAGYTHLGVVVGYDDKTSEPVIGHAIHSSIYFKNEFIYRYETMSNINENFVFKGYIESLNFEKSPDEYNYEINDPLIFIKSIMRPSYNLDL